MSNTLMKFFKQMSIIMAIIMVLGMLGACKKKDNGEISQASTGGTKTTAAKSTAKASTQTATNNKDTSTTSVNATDGNKTDGYTSNSIAEAGEETIADNVYSNIADIDFSGSKIISEDKKIDLGGKTIKGATWAASDIYRDTPDAGAKWVALYKKVQAAEKKYNFKFEQKAYDYGVYMNSIVNNAMAGTKLADILYIDATHFPTFVKNNIITPLDDYIDYETPILKANKALYNTTMWKGKHYGIMRDFQVGFPNCYYNKSLLSREGQPDIMDLVENKTWTWETFLNIASNCTRDTDGDGVTDQWGVVSSTSTFIREILHSNGVTGGVDIVNGEPEFNLDSLPALRALQFAEDLAFTHKVFINKQESKPDIYTKGNVAFYLDTFWNNRLILNMGVESGLAPLPMGPDVSEYQNISTIDFDCMSSACENPYEVANIIQDVCVLWDENLNPCKEYQELLDKLPYDWEWSNANSGYRKLSTEREYKLSMKSLFPLFKQDYSQGYPNLYTGRNILIKAFDNMLKGNASVTQTVDSVKAEVETIIAGN